MHTDDGPPARWIVNFDRDFVDGLVLAAVLAAYCPYLVSTALLQRHESSASSLASSLTITLDSFLCQDLEPLQQDVHQDRQPGADPPQQHHRVPGPERAWPQPGRAGK